MRVQNGFNLARRLQFADAQSSGRHRQLYSFSPKASSREQVAKPLSMLRVDYGDPPHYSLFRRGVAGLIRKPHVFDTKPNRAFPRGFPATHFSDLCLCVRLRVLVAIFGALSLHPKIPFPAAGFGREVRAKTGFVELNVTDDAQWEKAVAATIATLGGYDILINNAGIEITSLVVDLKAEDLRRMCDVNIVGTGLGMKHAFRAMRPGGGAGAGGAIVNIASVAATIAFPAIAGYSGTKSAVDRMTQHAAMETWN